jgi:hypothetical protein
MSEPPSLPGVWQLIAAAFRQNRLACLLLNVFVGALVASYYFWPPVAGLWQAVGEFKTKWSWLFSFGSTAFAAAVLPFAIQWLMGTLRTGDRVRRLIFLILFWGYRGMEIDLFYRIQGMLFGHGHDAATLALKLAVDQFIYSPFWAVPTYVIALRWVDCGCSWARTRASLDRTFFTRTLPAIFITNWIIWIPAVILVYSLPPALQFPLFSVIMCFFVLLVTLMTRSAPVSKRQTV